MSLVGELRAMNPGLAVNPLEVNHIGWMSAGTRNKIVEKIHYARLDSKESGFRRVSVDFEIDGWRVKGWVRGWCE